MQVNVQLKAKVVLQNANELDELQGEQRRTLRCVIATTSSLIVASSERRPVAPSDQLCQRGTPLTLPVYI